MSQHNVTDRRQRSERRTGGVDRRRPSDARCAVIEICRSTLHLAIVARGAGEAGANDRVVTRSIRWRKEASSLHTDAGTRELKEALRTLVHEERLAGAKLRIALGGEFCVTRVITGPTEDVRREFAELEDRSLRYLTLGPGSKALAGCTQQLDARHQHALLAVANQRTLDELMQIADAVGVQIESIEPSLIALSRFQARVRGAKKEACLIVQLDEDAAEIGVSHDGRLLLDYRPGGRTNAENVPALVAQHLSRLQRYIERYHSYLSAPLRDVYLAGDVDAVTRARQKFSELNNFNVHVLDPTELDMNWNHAAAAPGTDLAATLGTAMSLYVESNDKQAPNLMESALARLREPMRPILLRSFAPVAAVALVAIGLFAVHVKQWRDSSIIQAELDSLAPACARARELRLTLLAAENKLSQLAALEQELPQPNWQQILNRISQSMPDDVWLDRLNIQDGASGYLAGASYTDGGVYDFVGHLKQVPDVAEIALEGTGVGQSPTGPTTNFTLQLTLSNPADHKEKVGQND